MKVLFLQEHVRENHMKRDNDGSFKNVFLNTKAGKMLKDLVEGGLGLSKKDYYIDYAYYLVPQVIKRDKYDRAMKYKPPKASETKEQYEQLYERIVKEKPDIIIPSGNIGCKGLLGKAAISKLRGVPEKVTITSGEEDNKQEHTCWVLPTYSMEYMLVNPNTQRHVEADFTTISKFLEQGDQAFEAAPVDYEFVDSIDRVKEIFEKEIVNVPVVAWDLETNTLKPWFVGAKPLVLSMSWEHGQGVTIPLEHRDFTWKEEELNIVYNYLGNFVASEQYKVGANIKYDLQFLQHTKGFSNYRNHMDIQPMYYLLVDQETKTTLKLSDLSYELTDMGGYDKPLEDFKKQYKKEYIEREKERIKQLKADFKEREKVAKANKETIKKPEFPKAGPPVNEVDGSDFNYEWIPLVEHLHPYASGDTDAALRIFYKLDAKGKIEGNEKLRKLYTGHYTELTVALASMQYNGVMIDAEYNKKIQKAYNEECDRLVQKIRSYEPVKQVEQEHLELYNMGLEEWTKPKSERDEEIAKLRDKYKEKLEFNPNASGDLQKALFKYTGLRLPVDKMYLVDSAVENQVTKDDVEWFHFKTDTKNVLPYIVDNVPEYKEFAELLIEYSRVKTRRNNFTYKLLDMADHQNIIHGGFNLTGTETSRLSSSQPEKYWAFKVN